MADFIEEFRLAADSLPCVAAAPVELLSSADGNSLRAAFLLASRSMNENGKGNSTAEGIWSMGESVSLLSGVDHVCTQISAALHGVEFQLYAAIALALVASALLFPPRDDPDQI